MLTTFLKANLCERPRRGQRGTAAGHGSVHGARGCLPWAAPGPRRMGAAWGGSGAALAQGTEVIGHGSGGRLDSSQSQCGRFIRQVPHRGTPTSSSHPLPVCIYPRRAERD